MQKLKCFLRLKFNLGRNLSCVNGFWLAFLLWEEDLGFLEALFILMVLLPALRKNSRQEARDKISFSQNLGRKQIVGPFLLEIWENWPNRQLEWHKKHFFWILCELCWFRKKKQNKHNQTSGGEKNLLGNRVQGPHSPELDTVLGIGLELCQNKKIYISPVCCS